MLTSIILALSVSATPVTPVDTLDLQKQDNNFTTSDVVARKHIRVARKHIRVARKHIRVARKHIRVEDSSSSITTSL